MASRAPHALNHTSSPISFSYFVPLAHRALAMLACHRVLVPAMLSAWNALLQLFIHTADFTSQLQYPQALGHLKNSLALCPDAHYNLSLLYFSLRHLPLSQITSLCTCYNRMKAPWDGGPHRLTLLSLQGQADAWTTLAPMWFSPSRVPWATLCVINGTNPFYLVGPCLEPHYCLLSTTCVDVQGRPSLPPSPASGACLESRSLGPPSMTPDACASPSCKCCPVHSGRPAGVSSIPFRGAQYSRPTSSGWCCAMS